MAGAVKTRLSLTALISPIASCGEGRVPAPATFANTFVPLEDLGRHIDRVDTIFGVMTSSVDTPEVQALEREWSPRLAAASDALTFDAALFADLVERADKRSRNR